MGHPDDAAIAPETTKELGPLGCPNCSGLGCISESTDTGITIKACQACNGSGCRGHGTPNADKSPGPGWICPACGRGNAPWARYCPCTTGPTPYVGTVIDYGNGTVPMPRYEVYDAWGLYLLGRGTANLSSKPIPGGTNG